MTYPKIYLATILFGIFNTLPIYAISPTIVSSNQNPSQSANNSLLSSAQRLNQQGAEYLATGKPNLSLETWQQANKIYTLIQDKEGMIGTEINQAQAFQALGFYRQSLSILKSVKAKLQQEPSSTLKVKGLLSLGNTLKSLRVLKQKANSQEINFGATEILSEALQTALDINDSESADQIKLSLANTSELIDGQQKSNPQEKAIKEYKNLRDSTTSPLLKAQSKISLYKIESERNIAPNTLTFLTEIKKDLDLIPPSRSTIYAYINVVRTIQKNQKDNFEDQELLLKVAELLSTAIKQAQSIKDIRGEAQAIGALGDLYRITKQYKDAQKLTEQALVIAESLPAPDIAYRLQWQLGRILTITSPQNTSPAIKSYRQAVSHLKTLRNDLNASDADLQFSFRDSVEPVYREFVDLLLTGNNITITNNLANARDLIEALQVAELENSLRQGCLNTYNVQLDKIDRSATVVYPIVLKDRIVTITSIPQQKQLRYHSSRSISATDVEDTVNGLLEKIKNPELNIKQEQLLKGQSKEIYDLIVAPLAADLQKTNTKTLVFVLDGVLRNIPMSALYDGKKYLFEDYNLALTPGLQLVPPDNSSDRRQYQAFLGGISEARQEFPSLPQVKTELDSISKLLSSQRLLNADFNQNQASTKLASDNSSIVHFATHGEFSSDPEKTFILTWDKRLNLNQLSNLLQNRNIQSGKGIDLLVLSACQTAISDESNRATLGLAGVAIRARTKSAMASLWSVSDDSTQMLMTDFYQNLITKRLGKAESLRLAQQSLLQNPKYRSPYYWAPFVLVGNWQ